MGTLNALQRSPGALLRNPVLVIPVLVVGLFQLPQLFAQSTDPLLGSVFSLAISGLFVFIVPFFQGGIVGMADEALNGRTRLDTFVAVGKANYVRIFVAYLLLLVVNFVILGVLFVVGLAGGLLFFTQTDIPGFGFLVAGLFFSLLLLLFLLIVFFLQFYGQAIVLDDRGTVDGIKRSYRLVRENLLSTLGYSVVGGVIGGVMGLGFAALGMLISPESAQAMPLPQLTLPTIAALSVVSVSIASIIGAFLGVFSVAFYREISS